MPIFSLHDVTDFHGHATFGRPLRGKTMHQICFGWLLGLFDFRLRHGFDANPRLFALARPFWVILKSWGVRALPWRIANYQCTAG
jgi:hypothetical protein